MAQHAPELPTTLQLAEHYPVSSDGLINIELARADISSLLTGRAAGLFAIAGPCAMTPDIRVIRREAKILTNLSDIEQGMYATHRLPPWKPRTKPEDWFGLETTEPEIAYRILVEQAILSSGVSLEFGRPEHGARYGNLAAFGWFGGRNIDAADLMDQLAIDQPNLPLAVKNGLDGTIDKALEHVDRLNQLRGADGAPVVLLYRGGLAAQNPIDWEADYRSALEQTNGLMVVDIAHGTEMAHDPRGQFEKSVNGQIAAMEHVQDIATIYGELPAGIMIEASDAHSPTDPHMPFQIAVNGLRMLRDIRMSAIRTPARL